MLVIVGKLLLEARNEILVSCKLRCWQCWLFQLRESGRTRADRYVLHHFSLLLHVDRHLWQGLVAARSWLSAETLVDLDGTVRQDVLLYFANIYLGALLLLKEVLILEACQVRVQRAESLVDV